MGSSQRNKVLFSHQIWNFFGRRIVKIVLRSLDLRGTFTVLSHLSYFWLTVSASVYWAVHMSFFSFLIYLFIYYFFLVLRAEHANRVGRWGRRNSVSVLNYFNRINTFLVCLFHSPRPNIVWQLLSLYWWENAMIGRSYKCSSRLERLVRFSHGRKDIAFGTICNRAWFSKSKGHLQRTVWLIPIVQLNCEVSSLWTSGCVSLNWVLSASAAICCQPHSITFERRANQNICRFTVAQVTPRLWCSRDLSFECQTSVKY